MLIGNDDEKGDASDNNTGDENDDEDENDDFDYGTMVFNTDNNNTDNGDTTESNGKNETNNTNNNSNHNKVATTELNAVNHSASKPNTNANTNTKGNNVRKMPNQKVYNKALPNYAYPKKGKKWKQRWK